MYNANCCHQRCQSSANESVIWIVRAMLCCLITHQTRHGRNDRQSRANRIQQLLTYSIRWLWGKWEKFANKRIQAAVHRSFNVHRLWHQFRIPHVPGLPASRVFDGAYSPQLRSRLSSACSLVVSVESARNPTVLDCLRNDKFWCKSVDVDDFKCGCSELRKLFPGAPVNHRGHVAIMARQSGIYEDLGGANISAQSNVVVDPRHWKKVVEIRVKKLNEKVGIVLNNDVAFKMVDDHYAKHKFMSVMQSKVALWKKKLERCAVVSELDKMSSDMAFVCPWYWQRSFLRYICGGDYTYEIPDGMVMEYQRILSDLWYSHAVPKSLRGHRFGQLRWVLKYSAFDHDPDKLVCGFSPQCKEKFRPIASYLKNCLKKAFSASGACLDYICSVLFPAGINVSCARSVQTKLVNHNKSLQRWKDCGAVLRYEAFKMDVDDFFCCVPRPLVYQCWRKIVSMWRSMFGRRREFVVTVNKSTCSRKNEVTKTVHFAETDDNSMVRKIEQRGDILKPRSQNHRRANPDYYFCLSLAHIEELLLHDHAYGYCRFGSTLIVPQCGFSQGSPLSGSWTNAVLQCIEDENRSLFLYQHVLLGSALRWCDDIFWFSVYSVQSVDQDAQHDSALLHRDTVADYYVSRTTLSMKNEDSSTFAGVQIDFVDGLLTMKPVCKKPKYPVFQHFMSAVPRSRLQTLVYGQMFAVYDRCVNSNLTDSIVDLLMAFSFCGYPVKFLRRSLKMVAARFPSTTNTMNSAEAKWLVSLCPFSTGTTH